MEIEILGVCHWFESSTSHKTQNLLNFGGFSFFLLVQKTFSYLYRLKTTITTKKIIISLFALLGLASCSQQSYEYETDSFTTKSGKTVKFHALTHASIRIEYDGKEIVIDPVTKLGDKTIDYTTMPKADYLFITHEHFDHFDTLATKQLTGDNTQLITNQRCADMLGYGKVMANGDTLQPAEDFTVEAVPAYNTTQ